MVAAGAAASALAGCVPLRPAPAPMPTVSFGEPARAGDRCLIVFLPGRYDSPETFGREGFPDLVRGRLGDVALVAADAHIGYYARKTVLERLHDDVIEPARRRGVRHVWIVGVSMGGLGALGYASRYPGAVDGIVLLSPYLGERPVIDEILAAGGPASWQPPADVEPDDYSRALWRWLRRYAGDGAPSTRLFLGYGRDDRMALADGMLAGLLPPDRVVVVAGGHDWATWRTVFRRFVADGVLDGCRR